MRVLSTGFTALANDSLPLSVLHPSRQGLRRKPGPWARIGDEKAMKKELDMADQNDGMSETLFYVTVFPKQAFAPTLARVAAVAPRANPPLGGSYAEGFNEKSTAEELRQDGR
eukprot:gene14813-20869_t